MGLARTLAMPFAVAAALLCAPLAAQTRPNRNDAKRLIEKADKLAWLYNWYLAGPLYAEAEGLYEEAGDARNALYARIGRLRSEWETMSFPEVSEYLTNALESPLVQNDPQLRLWILDAKGAVDLEVNTASAQRVYEEARVLARNVGDKAREARAAGELGIIAFLTGDAGDSVELLGDAIRTSIELKDVGAHIRYLNVLGNGLTLFGRPEDAIRYFDRALQLVDSTLELDTSVLAVAGKAKALIALNKTSQAEKLFHETLDRARLRHRRGLAASILTEMAEAKVQTGERGQAIEYYEEAAALAASDNLNRVVAMAMFGLANLYQDMGDLEKAEDRAARGVEASQKVGEIYELPSRLALLARLNSNRGEIAEADRLYEQAEDVIDGLLVSMTNSAARTSVIGVMSQVYVDHFTLVVDRLNDPVRALEVLERARGRTALDVLSSREEAPMTLTQAQSAHQKEISRLQILLMRAIPQAERRDILDKLFDEEHGLTGAESSPLRDVLGRGQPADVHTLQQTLQPDEMIAEYALGYPRSYCLLIDKSGIRAVPLPGRDRIESLVNTYLSEVRSKKSAMAGSRELYSMLLEPLAIGKVRRLIIVPDGKLHLLPFDALVDTTGEYFLKSHVVTYAPSATVFHLLRSTPENVAGVPLLAVGDVPYEDDGNLITHSGDRTSHQSARATHGLYDLEGGKLPRLPGTSEEVTSIAQIAGPQSIVLIGDHATEANFRAQALNNIRVLHLAVHGISSSAAPERAALVLGRNENDGYDGLLQAREISSLRLSADLVTLSACDTGAGRLEGQEGVVNLIRSFLFAGARSVVASVWAADDVFTTSLMKRFYANLSRGQDGGAALRDAKQELLEQFGDQAVPFYWAGFLWVGDGSSRILFSK